MLRSFRFATKLEFSVGPEIAEAIQNPDIRVNETFITLLKLHKGFLNLFFLKEALEKKVSRERIRTELQKMLVDPNAARGLSLIYE